MSQTDLARETGLTFQQVQKYEKGVNRISAGRLFEMAKVLKKPITFFYRHLDADSPSEDGNTDTPLSNFGTDRYARLMLYLSKIDDSEICDTAVQSIESLAQLNARQKEAAAHRDDQSDGLPS